MGDAPLVKMLGEDCLLAVGTVAAQWGYFEANFAGKFSILRRSTQVLALSPNLAAKLPFVKLAAEVKKAARVAFSASLADHIVRLVDTALHLANKRNVIVHGLWLNFRSELSVAERWDGTGTVYTVTVENLYKLAEKIADLDRDWSLTFLPPGISSPLLTSHETSEWQAFQATYPPPTHHQSMPQAAQRREVPFRA